MRSTFAVLPFVAAALAACGGSTSGSSNTGGSAGHGGTDTGASGGAAGNAAGAGGTGGTAGTGGAGDPACVPVDQCGSSPGAVIKVAAGGDLQAALDTASPGDTIELAAGATFTGNFTLPKKAGDGCITVRTSTPDTMLPPRGTRLTPDQAPSLARIVASGAAAAITTADGAHHYRFVGIEIAPEPGSYSYGLVELGRGDESTVEALPHHLVLDHVYVHGDPAMGAKRCVALNSTSTTIVDSYIADCKGVAQDTQAICGWNGPGPFAIVNNYLEGAAENVMFGGAINQGEAFVPSDIAVCYNHFRKPLSWRVGDPSYAGTHWSVKNHFELKAARRVHVHGNLFEQNWADAQNGFSIVLTPRTERSGADVPNPWNVVEDVTFTGNIIRRTNNAVNLTGHDDDLPTLLGQRLAFRNNLFVDIGSPAWFTDGGAILFQAVNGADSVTIEHNTGLQSGKIFIFDYLPLAKLVFSNNITTHNEYGIFGSGAGVGNDALAMYAPDGVVKGNVIAALPDGISPSMYPDGNYFPASLDEVGFVNLAGGDYRLGPNSPYLAKGTDGLDPGVDWEELKAAQSFRSP